MVQIDRVIEPDKKIHAEYQPFYESYKASYEELRKIRRQLKE